MKLKIGFLTERMLLGYGVDLVVHEAAKRLARLHDVTVYTTSSSDFYGKDNYTICDLTQHARGFTDIYHYPYFHAVMPMLQSSGTDVWIMETPPFYQWILAFKPPVICIEHGTPPGRFFNRKLGKRLDETTKDRYHKVYSQMRPGDGLVTISQYIKSCLPAVNRKNACVIPNGADHYPRCSMETAAKFRMDLNIRADEILILWVGRIQPHNDGQPYKGFHEFIQIAADVRKHCPQVRFAAAGRGDEESECYLREKQIIPLINLSRDLMPVAMYAADIFLNTSKWEGFNLPLVEAQFQGTPVIAYDLCSHPEVVTNGVSGLLVKSTHEMKNSLLKLVNDENLRDLLSTGARKMSSRFTWENNAESLLRLIENCRTEAEKREGSYIHRDPLKKNLKYYLTTGKMIIKNEGMGVLIKEFVGTLKRKIKKN